MAETPRELADRVCAEAREATRADYRAMTGRINVTTSGQTVELRLYHWALKPTATLNPAEVRELIDKLDSGLAKLGSRRKSERSLADDDYSDIA